MLIHDVPYFHPFPRFVPLQAGLRRSYLADVAAGGAAMRLRLPPRGACARRVPVCVASAGFSDVIAAVLAADSVAVDDKAADDSGAAAPPPLLRIPANRMVFADAAASAVAAADDEKRADDDGPMTGFADASPLHSGNKELTYARERGYFDAHLRDGRRAVVVLGDRPGDVAAVDGLRSLRRRKAPPPPRNGGGGGGDHDSDDARAGGEQGDDGDGGDDDGAMVVLAICLCGRVCRALACFACLRSLCGCHVRHE